MPSPGLHRSHQKQKVLEDTIDRWPNNGNPVCGIKKEKIGSLSQHLKGALPLM